MCCCLIDWVVCLFVCFFIAVVNKYAKILFIDLFAHIFEHIFIYTLEMLDHSISPFLLLLDFAKLFSNMNLLIYSSLRSRAFLASHSQLYLLLANFLNCVNLIANNDIHACFCISPLLLWHGRLSWWEATRLDFLYRMLLSSPLWIFFNFYYYFLLLWACWTFHMFRVADFCFVLFFDFKIYLLLEFHHFGIFDQDGFSADEI